MEIFDLDLYIKRLIHAQKNLSDFDFLLKQSALNIAERLKDVKRDFTNIIEIGYRSSHLYDLIKTDNNHYTKASIIPSLKNEVDVIYHPETLPLEQAGTYDLILCNLHAHHINDLPGLFIQARHLLQKDGLFITSLFGVETLKELRQSIQTTQSAYYNKISPQFAPLVDIRDAGALLQRAGFAIPVADKENIIVSYKDIHHLIKDLRGMGETNIMKSQNKRIPPKQLFSHADDFYKEHFTNDDDLIDATFEILYLTGWSPDKSQQQPLKPGSAKTSLASALNTKETSL